MARIRSKRNRRTVSHHTRNGAGMKHRKLGFLHGITQRLRRRFRDGAVRLCPTARRGLVVCIRVLIGAFGANGVAGLSAGQVFTLAAGQVTAPVRVSIPSRAGSAIAVARTMPASGGRESRLRALAVEMSSHAAEALRIAAWSDAITPTIEAPIELDRSEIWRHSSRMALRRRGAFGPHSARGARQRQG